MKRVASLLALTIAAMLVRCEETVPNASGKRLASAARMALNALEKYNDYQKDPSASALMPKIREVVEKLQAQSKQPEEATTRTQVGKLKMEFFMLCQEARERCLSPEEFGKSAQNASRFYLEQKEKLKDPLLTDEEKTLVARADALSQQYKNVAEVTKPATPAVATQNLRKHAELDDLFAQERKKIVQADALCVDLPAKVKAAETQLALAKKTYHDIEAKLSDFRKKNSANSSTQAYQDTERKLLDDINRKSDEITLADRKFKDLDIELRIAKNTIHNSCLILRGEAKRDPYAGEMFNNPALQTPGEKKWAALFKKAVIMKDGVREDVTEVQDLGGMWKLIDATGHSRTVDKRDVREILDIK